MVVNQKHGRFIKLPDKANLCTSVKRTSLIQLFTLLLPLHQGNDFGQNVQQSPEISHSLLIIRSINLCTSSVENSVSPIIKSEQLLQ